MAYFPNGSAGEVFDVQCAKCIYGELPCPIFLVQSEFNYEACNNKTARAILDHLVHDDGICTMYAMDPKNFHDPHYQQGELAIEMHIDQPARPETALDGSRIADDQHCQTCGARGVRGKVCPTCERG